MPRRVLVSREASTIDSVLGANLVAWFRADQGLSLTSTDVDSWADITGNCTLSPSTPELFTYEATGFNGEPSIVTDGAGLSGLSGTLTSTISSGSRPYMWLVAQYTDLTNAYLASLHSTGDTRWMSIGEFDGDWEGCWNAAGSTGFSSFSSSTSDTNRHLFEIGFPAGATNAIRVSGVASNGSTGTAPDAAMTTIRVNNMNASTTSQPHAEFRIAELIVSDSIPSSGQLASILGLLEARYGTL